MQMDDVLTAAPTLTIEEAKRVVQVSRMLDVGGITTADLINVLIAKGRVKVVEATGAFYKEYAGDDHYMHHLDEMLRRHLIRGLECDLLIKYQDSDAPREESQQYRCARLAVLLQKDQTK